MASIAHFVKIIRWPNVVMVAGIQAIVFFSLIDMSVSVLHGVNLALLILITMIITAGGNMINDYYDIELDAINRPGRRIAGHHWSAQRVLVVYKWVVFLGAIPALLLAFRLTLGLYFPVYLIAVVGLQLYSTHLKCRPVIGNFWVAMYCAAVVLVVAFPDLLHGNFQAILPSFWYYVVFALLVTFFRENVKDLEDVEGDKQCGCHTLAVRFGPDAARKVAVVAGLVSLVALYFWENSHSNTMIRLGLYALQGALVASMALLWWAKDKTYYHKASTVIKFVMIGGTLLLLIPSN